MRIPTVVLKLSARDYSKLAALASKVAVSLQNNPDFLSPTVAINELRDAASAVTDAIAIWGPPANRGSKASLLDLRQKAKTLFELIRVEAAYVIATSSYLAGNNYSLMASIMGTSGFTLKANGHNQGVLNKVQDFRFKISDALNRNQVKLTWDKPSEVTTHTNVKCYNVYRSLTASFADAVLIDSVSKTDFLITNNTGATVTWTYFVAPVGAAGIGAVSEPLSVSLFAF